MWQSLCIVNLVVETLEQSKTCFITLLYSSLQALIDALFLLTTVFLPMKMKTCISKMSLKQTQPIYKILSF